MQILFVHVALFLTLARIIEDDDMNLLVSP